MKKLSIILLAIIFVLTGCSSMSEESSDTASVTPDNVINEEPTTVDSTDGSSDSDTTQEDNDVVDDNTNDEAVNPEDVPDDVFVNDKFLVGKDIPAGEYYVGVDGGEGSFAIFENETAEGVITFQTFDNNAFVAVEEGQYIELTNAYAVPIEETPNMVPEDGSYNTGMYRVGIDIPAGDYAINVDENVKSGTYTVSNDMNAVDIITSGDVTSASSATITLEEGQYLILQHCNALIDTN